MSDLQRAHVQNIYRPVSIIFALLVVFLIGGVAYAGWSSTVITITPRQTKVTASFPMTVTSAAGSVEASILQGTIVTEDKSATIIVTPKGTGTPVPAHASGTVTLKNTTAEVQPLAAGTRLQSANKVIVRTKERVDVPAGGTVITEVIADPLGEEGNVPAGKFIIVALWPGLQDKIYGESTEALSGGLAVGGTSLSLDKLTTASNQAEAEIRTAVGDSSSGKLITMEPSSVVSVPKPEVASNSYKVTVKMKVTTITYQADELSKVLQSELTKSLPDGQSLGTISTPTVSVLDRPSTDQIVLQVDGQSTAQLTTTHQLFKPAVYTGLTITEIKKKLSDASIINSVTVKLSPWWRKTAPEQPERISIVISPAK